MTGSAEVARRFYALVSAARVAEAVELVSPEFVGHGLGAGGGRDALHDDLATWAGAFPDLDVTVEEVVVEGERVAVRLRMRGSHTGPFAGIPPTGRAVEVAATAVLRVEGGRIAEAWTLCDLAGLFVQLGALPGRAAQARESSRT